MSSLTAIAARYGVETSDADGYDLDEYALRRAVIGALVSRTDEQFKTVERLAPVCNLNLYAGEYRAAETALRYALVDLDSLKPTLREIAAVGERLEAARKVA